MLESDINQAGLSKINHDRISKLLIRHENPMIEMMNEQSKYVRKWFLFIAVFALILIIFRYLIGFYYQLIVDYCKRECCTNL
ncbi:unnamed protein product [Rotaria sp. Silwood2]|nr:unnamed protein product [Rotaria sp. Silwood2]